MGQNNYEEQVTRVPFTDLYRGEFHEGDTHLLNGAAVSATNNKIKSHAILAATIDNQSVAVYGRSAQTSIYGLSDADNAVAIKAKASNNALGIVSIAANNEAVHAETSSGKTAALAAYQKNTDSTSAALFAKHDGGGVAGVFDGSVHISKELRVSNVNMLNYTRQLESSIRMLAGKLGVPVNIQSIHPQMTLAIFQDTQLRAEIGGSGFTPQGIINIKYTFSNAQSGWVRQGDMAALQTDNYGNFKTIFDELPGWCQLIVIKAVDKTSGVETVVSTERIAIDF